MNFKVLLDNPSLVESYYEKLSHISNSLEKSSKNLKKVSEDHITKNFITISKCSQIGNNLRILTSFFPKFNITSTYNQVENTIANCLDNLDSIANSLKPASYIEDIDFIKNLLKNSNLDFSEDSFIFPDEEKIIISTIFKTNKGNLIFTTSYDSNQQYKNLNLLNTDILPGNFDLGINIEENLEDVFNALVFNKPLDQIDSIIEKSEIFDTFIKASIKERVNTNNALNIIKSSIGGYIEKSYIHQGDVILKLGKLNNIEASKISKLLKLNKNDTYKFLAMHKEY